MEAGRDIGILFPKYAFWDVDPDKLDLSRDRKIVVDTWAALLELGNQFNQLLKEEGHRYCLVEPNRRLR